MRTKKRKKRKKRTGSVRWLFGFLCLLACFASLFADEKKKKPSSSEYSVIAGSVFRDPGFALAGTEVVLEPVDPKSGKKQKMQTNFRGEFAFRVPVAAAKYNVSVAAKGLKGETKPAATQGGAAERIDVTFLLSPVSN